MSVIGSLANLATNSIGQGIGYATSKALQNNAFANQLKLQLNNQNFQEHMGSTNYQRQVADMEKAGLNPAIAGESGVGAQLTSTNDFEKQASMFDAIDSLLSNNDKPQLAHIRAK